MKILIVDDEKPARDRLRQLLDDFEGHEIVGEAANGEQAISMAAELGPEIVLLDIRMPGINGIETARHLSAMESPPAVVFTTAYDEYAVEAFDARAVGYVLKPVRRERLRSALEQATRLGGQALSEIAVDAHLESRRQHVCTRMRGVLHLIPIRDVSFFSADQKYVSAHHVNGQGLIDDSLKSLEQEFADDFVRIHRGALVAVNQIRKLEKLANGKSRIVLRDDSQHDNAGPTNELVISRRHLADVRRRLKGV